MESKDTEVKGMEVKKVAFEKALNTITALGGGLR